LSQVTKGVSLRVRQLIIILRARSIITIIISTIWRRGLLNMLRWSWGCKTTKARLATSDATDFDVHLTHLIGKMVKTTTKISTHMLKLIHDFHKEIGALNEEEGADEEEGWEEGVAGFVGATSEASTQGRFTVSCAALLRIDSLHMAPVT